MFFMVRNATKRVYDRSALGIKRLLIGDNVENGSPVDINVNEEDAIFLVEKVDKEYVKASHEYIEDFDSIEEEEIQVLTDRFSPVVNFGRNFGRKTALEVTFMDDCMLVNLLSGAIFIDSPNPTDESSELLAYRNVPELTYGGRSVSSEVNWVSMDKLKQILAIMYKIDINDINDYVFELYIDAESAGSSGKGGYSSSVSYGLRDYFDISLGNIKSCDSKELELKRESVGDAYTGANPVQVDEDADCENLGVGSSYEQDDEYDDGEYYDDYEEPVYIDYGSNNGEDENDDVDGFHVVGGNNE